MLSDQVMIPNAKKLPNSQNTISDIHITADQKNSYGCDYSSASETGEKCQGSKNTTKDNVGSEDAITDENINNEEHEDKSDYEDSSATKTGKKRQGSKKASEDKSGSEDVHADGSATNEEQQDEADYEDSSAIENGKTHQGRKSASEDDAASKNASANGNATIEEQDHDSYSEDSSASENGKKRQESKSASEDDAASEDANANGNATIEEQKHNSNSEDSNANENEKKVTVVKIHLKMTLALKKTNLMLFRKNSRIMTNCTLFLPLKNYMLTLQLQTKIILHVTTQEQSTILLPWNL